MVRKDHMPSNGGTEVKLNNLKDVKYTFYQQIIQLFDPLHMVGF